MYNQIYEWNTFFEGMILFSITRYMNGVCFKVSGGTSVPKLTRVPPPHLHPRDSNKPEIMVLLPLNSKENIRWPIVACLFLFSIKNAITRLHQVEHTADLRIRDPWDCAFSPPGYFGHKSCSIYTRGFKRFEENCCQICNCHGRFAFSVHVVNKHIVNIYTKFE